MQKNLTLHQVDITSAFLNGHLEEEILMNQPEGFVEKKKEHLVCKLKRSIYGLKQAPRCWNTVLDAHLKEMRFQQSYHNPCIYTHSGGDPFIIGVYIDDMVLASRNANHTEEVKIGLAKKFEIKDLGELSYFLGVNIKTCKNGAVWMGQSTYSESTLRKYEMEESKAVSTPVDIGIKLTKATEDCEPCDPVLFQSAVGSLIYLSTKTRPDIAYAVNSVARFCSKPTKVHWTAFKRIFRYLRGTTTFLLLYQRNESSELIVFSDADWGGDAEDSKSTSGYCFEIGGTIIS